MWRTIKHSINRGIPILVGSMLIVSPAAWATVQLTRMWAGGNNSSVVTNFTKLQLADQYMEQTFKQCLPYTLNNTVKLEPDGTTYIITGDIPAMWVRDASAQLYPYVFLSKNSATLQRIISGTILRFSKNFNSSYEDAPFINSWQEDYTPHEYKFEPDGVAYFMRLVWLYWKVTGDESWAHKSGAFSTYDAFNRALALLKSSIGFTGMVKCKYRPSDDATTYPYLVPTNMFLASMLPKLAELYEKVWQDPTQAAECERISKTIREGINKYGVYANPIFGEIWAYEVNGVGGVLLMDDANIPSLLAAPYLEFCEFTDPIYQNTRRYVLSSFNPYYFTGSYGQGVGSPHTQNSWVWPLAVVMQALTATDIEEINQMFIYLNNLDGGTHYMHESVNPNDPTQYTRSAFAWGNALYAEAVIKKITGFTFPTPNATTYIKPYLTPECNKVDLNNSVDFGRATGLTLHILGEGAQIDYATINGEPAEIDKGKGVKVTLDNAAIVIHMTKAEENGE